MEGVKLEKENVRAVKRKRGGEQGHWASGQGPARGREEVICGSTQGPVVRTWQGGLVFITAGKEVDC